MNIEYVENTYYGLNMSQKNEIVKAYSSIRKFQLKNYNTEKCVTKNLYQIWKDIIYVYYI